MRIETAMFKKIESNQRQNVVSMTINDQEEVPMVSELTQTEHITYVTEVSQTNPF